MHLLLGFRRLRDRDYYQEDPLVRRVLGLQQLPDVATISRSLADTDERSVEGTRRLLRTLVLERIQREQLRHVTLDFDGSVLSTKGHAEGTAIGYNPRRKGQRSYYPLFCTVAQTRQFLDVLHRSGNVHDSGTLPRGRSGMAEEPRSDVYIAADQLPWAAFSPGIAFKLLRASAETGEGVASVMSPEGKSNFIRPTGEPLTPGAVEASWGPQAASIAEGLLAQTDETSGKTGFVDASGTWVIGPRFDAAADFSDGLAGVWIRSEPEGEDATESDEEGGVGFIDPQGKLVIPATFPFLTGWTPSFSEGLALMPKPGTTQYEIDHGTAQMGFIDKAGKWLIPAIYDASSERFSGGLAHVYVGGEERYIDPTGKAIGPQRPR